MGDRVDVAAAGVATAWLRAGSAYAVWPARLVVAVLAGGALLAGTLTLRSLSWPMAHDGPLMHYVAWLIRQGAVPYREVFDMNFPGTYLLHLLALTLFGPSDLGFRLFDLSVLAATAAGLVAAGRPFGRLAGPGAALIFWLYHVAGGAWQAAQRDFLLAPFLAWGVAWALRALQGRRPAPPALAGAFLGFGLWIKPHALLFLLGVLLLLLARREGGGVGPASLFTAGAALPGAGILGWLAWAGGLGSFLDLVRGYLLPLYSDLGGDSLRETLRWHAYGGPLWVALALLVGLSLYGAIRERALDRRHALLVIGLVYGGVHFFGQGKGWEYQLTPLALFASLLGASGLARVCRDRGEVQIAAVTALAALVAVLGVKGSEALDAPWYTAKRDRAVEMAAAIRPHLRPGDTVQVLDTTDGGVHALYLLGARQPTRFLYDFHFYHDETHPIIRALRAELVEGLRRRPPAFVVLVEETWLRPGYARVRGWPALDALLRDQHTLWREGAGYRIYAKRTDP